MHFDLNLFFVLLVFSIFEICCHATVIGDLIEALDTFARSHHRETCEVVTFDVMGPGVGEKLHVDLTFCSLLA